MASAPFRAIGSAGSDKKFACTSCGSENFTIIRPDATNPRCKCGGCGFVYNGADSLAAQEAGAIGTSSAATLAAAAEPEREELSDGEPRRLQLQEGSSSVGTPPSALFSSPVHGSIPRNPTYVFIGKDRKNPRVEFCAAKDVKRVALKWHETKHDVYELAAKSFAVNVEIN